MESANPTEFQKGPSKSPQTLNPTEQTEAPVLPIEKITFLLTLVASLISVYWKSPQITVSVFLGGVVGILNFRLLARLGSRLVAQPSVSQSQLSGLFLILKFPLLLGLFALLIWKAPIHLFGFVVGFLLLSLAIVLAVVWQFFSSSS